MKNLIKLPKQVAALLTHGVIPAVRLKTPPIENKQCYFVYATSKRVDDPEMPIEWVMEANNQQLFGNIPTDDKLHEEAFIGWVEVSNQPYADSSIWRAGDVGQMYHVVCRRVFDYPLHVNPSDAERFPVEQMLNAFSVHHVSETYELFALGDELEVPVNDGLFLQVARQGKLMLDLTADVAHQVLDVNGELKQFTRLTLNCGNRSRDFSFSGEILTVLNNDYEPVLYPSVVQCCGKDVRKKLLLYCGTSFIH